MRYLLLVLILMPVTGAVAQEAVYLGSQRQAVRITTLALYQRYVEGDAHIEEVTFPVSMFLPLSQELGLSLRASPARASGQGLETVSSLSDAQVALTYSRAFRRSSLVLGVSANLPSGKTTLSPDEFGTSRLLSQNFYDFHLPVFGQGLNVAPSLTVAIPVHNRVVVGIGAAYQIKGPFTPTSAFTDDYNPGDEFLLTGGLDVRLGSSAALSGDVTYTTYASDKIGDAAVFSSGDRVTLTAQYLQYVRQDEVRILARYRTKGKSELPAGDGTSTEIERTVPNQAEVLGQYRTRLIENATLMLLAQGRFYSKTEQFESKSLIDFGVAPEYAISDEATVLTRFVYTVGSFSGVSAGIGLGFAL